MTLARCLIFAFSLAAATLPAVSQSIPQTDATTLTGAHVAFPESGNAKPLLLLLGFSHKSSGDMAIWNKKFKVPYETDPRVQYYELADFQGVPPFAMKMILHGMRRSIQEPERSHMVPFHSEEAAWEKLVYYNDPKIVYVVFADASGHVLWQTRGPATDSKAAELEAAVARLTSTQH